MGLGGGTSEGGIWSLGVRIWRLDGDGGVANSGWEKLGLFYQFGHINKSETHYRGEGLPLLTIHN